MFEKVLSGLEKAIDVGAGIASAMMIRNLVQLPRDEALNRLAGMVDTMTEDQLDTLDANLLNSTLFFMDVEKRHRATEIYAVFKILETTKFGRFRGFSTGGHALH